MLFKTRLSLLLFETSPSVRFEETCQVKLLVGDRGGLSGIEGLTGTGGLGGYGVAVGGVTGGTLGVIGGDDGAGVVLF